MSDSTATSKASNHQAAKPYPEFPLTAHPTGRWCKKVRGKLRYFGPIGDPDAALAMWLDQRDDLMAGRVPRAKRAGGITLADLANLYLGHKESLLKTGELSIRTFNDCHHTCAVLIKRFGRDRLIDDITQDDFAELREALATTRGPVGLGNSIQRTRSVFKFAHEAGMLDAPTVFGPRFKRPSKKVMRLDRAKTGPRLLERDELISILGVAGRQMRAMVLLALNAGLGNSDLANLPLSAVNLDTGWVDYPRPKTGIPRRFPLWPETLDALKAVLAKRTKPKEKADAGLVFITKYGGRWTKAVFERKEAAPGESAAEETYRVNNDNAVGKEFTKLMNLAEVPRRKGRSFYTLRHVFATVAGESRDQPAVDHVMGHAREDMASVYRERIGDDRLSAVVEHVRGWLFVSEK